MVLPATGTDGGATAVARGANHRDVRARPAAGLDQPAQDGTSGDAPNTASSSVAAARAFVWRLTRSDRRDVLVVTPPAVPPGMQPVLSAPAPSGRALEAELAERLDTVLGIAERLAASHDRADLFRTIVDETKRALRADATTIRILRDDHPRGRGLGRPPRRPGRGVCRSSSATRAGSARSCARATSLA